jgi:hypothetical protein
VVALRFWGGKCKSEKMLGLILEGGKKRKDRNVGDRCEKFVGLRRFVNGSFVKLIEKQIGS